MFVEMTAVAKAEAGGIWDLLRNQPFFRAQPPAFSSQLASTSRPTTFGGLNVWSCSLHTSVSYWFQQVPLPVSQSQNQTENELQDSMRSFDSFFSVSSTAATTLPEYYKRLQMCTKDFAKAHRMWIFVLSVWTFWKDHFFPSRLVYCFYFILFVCLFVFSFLLFF